ncbi:mannitol dehydrogenase family protein [Mesorhizobium sp. ZC-5]|uniref:mannitol dehydrogenase family protein n=1 Tax=Mesorhizobium sp. ZC-5 TaxID=2986066 RepID=UPI0021E8A567|nr:mannitol dehydrogenase family protein [Mesorhizobium sp. ZC-5]MCV3242919.1 mannitol dehydrogenase family protein [Mesorhizobium sp. ZC-5]
MRHRLSSNTLTTIPAPVACPRYDRSAVVPGIVHLGLGAFHRAHQAAYVEDCLAAGETGWGIVGASLRSTDTRDALGPQDGLYTLAVRDGEHEGLRVVGSIVSVLVAPENPEALLDALIDPRIRIVTLTVTEKAYLRNAAGDLDTRHPDVAWDLSNPDRPKTLYGFLAEGLARRRSAGTPPFTVLCCDNLPANGATLRRLLLEFAAERDAELEAHITGEVAFPSSMVDRIVPATTDADRARVSERLGADDAWPVMTEPFCQWVVEDNFTAGRPDWEKFGVTMVEDVRPFEDMKLRLLNGSHSAIAYLGLLLGHATVAEAFADPAIRRFVGNLWAETIPTLPKGAGLDPQAYIEKLANRYANTSLQHRTAQIANDGSQKLPQRVIASALDRAGENTPVTHLMLVVAAWIAACEARGGKLSIGLFSDPLDGPLADIAAGEFSAAETVRRVFDAAGFAKDQNNRERLMSAAADHLETIRRKGASVALSELAEKDSAA